MREIFKDEIRAIFKDSGALLLLVGAIVIYTALYGVIYTPEVARNIPVAVVDLDQTPSSRELQRMVNATPAAVVAYNAESLDEAKSLFMQRKVDGVMLIAKGYENNIQSGRQATVSIYADGSYFLLYSSFLNAFAEAVMDKGAQLQHERLERSGLGEANAKAVAKPIDYKIEMLYNPYGGYATALLPAVFVVILQQVLLLGIGLVMGSRFEFGGWRELEGYSTLKIVLTKALVYFILYIPLLIYVYGAVYKFFGFAMHENTLELAAFLVPYLFSSVMLGFTLGALVNRRESTVLYYAVLSLFFIMLSGISWSEQGMPSWLYGLGHIVPSSSAINGFVRMRTCGASLSEVGFEWSVLWILSGVYFLTALLAVSRIRYKAKKRYANTTAEIIPTKSEINE